MTAVEARDKALWNKISEDVKHRITYSVSRGLFEATLYQSTYPSVFNNEYNKPYLTKLGYCVEYDKLKFEDGSTDTKMTISW